MDEPRDTYIPPDLARQLWRVLTLAGDLLDIDHPSPTRILLMAELRELADHMGLWVWPLTYGEYS